MTARPRSHLVVEGWRFLPHSYALVAQSHCLSLARRDDIELRFVDLPFYDPAWKPARGIFAAADEAVLAALHSPEEGFETEATFTLRPERPDFTAPRTGRRFSFATAEFRVLAPQNTSGLTSAAEVPSSVDVVTPSRWAAVAYQRFGFSPERVHVVPHGIDPSVFRPDDAARRSMRASLGIGDAFLFVSAGAMTWNKGLDLLLSAFARVVQAQPQTRLLLKGADALYPSRAMVSEVLQELSVRDRSAVQERLIYEGRTFSAKLMADLLRAADCYVSPYRAEGFNMPVLEAMACGVPVLCTEGGPTDEFTDPAFAWRIRSRSQPRRLAPDCEGEALEPDLDHLVMLMRDAASGEAGRRGPLAAAHAHQRFSWDAVTDTLRAILFAR